MLKQVQIVTDADGNS